LSEVTSFTAGVADGFSSLSATAPSGGGVAMLKISRELLQGLARQSTVGLVVVEMMMSSAGGRAEMRWWMRG